MYFIIRELLRFWQEMCHKQLLWSIQDSKKQNKAQVAVNLSKRTSEKKLRKINLYF